ncbi:uncharacterized protein C5orf47 homolog isoform X1 [Cervus elaphus]|uniref:uncharacterized protein C5orf47 homolog isoform X1 n=1 Tax=Cervus elaphus TaxID=9860 RepID=UPI001CC2F11F|nr:uncharacterized protein C5orf47 homolog isoform X1 [Cervus elaphus]
MAAARQELQRDRARFVYVTRFGSHQCGGVLPLGGRRAQGPRHAGLKDGHSQEKPRAAAPPSPGLTQKNLAKKFDFPIPLSETSKIMKKNKKVLVWNGVYKIISKMLKENEKYRLRLKCQQLSSENSKDTK